MRVLALWGLLGTAALLPAQKILIEGVLVNAATGAGIGGVRLFAGQQMVLTDQAGVFRGTVAKPGDYSGYVMKQRGYLEDLVQFQFHVNADGSPARPRVELTPLAILRGRVIGIDGKLARVTVELGPSYKARADEDGNFAFDQLPPGSYTLLARPETAEPVVTPEGLRTALVPTFYPSALERTQAESIVVRPGAELTGYEIRLQTSPLFRVSGVVLDSAGKPAPDALVQLLDIVADGINGSNGEPPVFSIRRNPVMETPSATQSTSTGDDGTFEFLSVQPGEWTIRVHSDSMRDEIQQRDVVLFGGETISLGSRDLEDLQIRLATPIDVSGTVERGDASPSISRYVTVALNGEAGYFGGSASPDANGALRFEGVIPGRYLISAGVGGNYYASVLWGSSDVTGQTVELTASSPPFRVVIKHGGTIRWTLDQSGSWAVVFLPQRLTGFGYYAMNPLKTSELNGIPPGEYYAIALDRFNPNTMADVPHLRELVPRATKVRVEEGSDVFVQLKINHALD